jgi:glycosyltransferase involved in cell wall biosynthesis
MTLSISVVMPSYNQAEFIEKTIQSVLSQDVPNLEFVIYDNLSNDGTIEILKRYEPQLCWISEKDKGQGHAVNKGIQNTSGDIIGWLNSDDIYYPGALKSVLEFFQTHPEIDLVYGDADHIDTEDEWIEDYYTEPWDYERLKDVCFLCQPAVFFHRRVAEKFGLLDERLYWCMDYEYWLRVGLGGAKVAYLPQKLAGSRMYPENKTLRSIGKVHREYLVMLSRALGSVPDKWLYNYAHAVLDERGIPRTSKKFAVLVSVSSLWTAIRWNRKISKDMAQTTIQWILDSLRRTFKVASS